MKKPNRDKAIPAKVHKRLRRELMRKKLKSIGSGNMTRFMKMIVENAYTFDGVNEVPLDNVGLVDVTGVNEDTKDTSSNGAGKSRIWACLLRLFYGRKALGREPVNAAYNPTRWNFRVEVWLRKNGHLYVARECKKHDHYPDGLKITCDGKPWGAKNEPELLRREFQTKVLNRTYEEFVGTVIWKQNHDHILLSGGPSERNQWISNFFGLNVYDELYKKFSDKYEAAKQAVIGLADTRARAKVLSESLAKAGDIATTRSRIKRIKADVEELVGTSDSNTVKLKRLREKEADLKQVEVLKTKILEADAVNKTPVDVQKAIDSIRTSLAEQENNLRLASDATSITEEYTRYRDRAKKAEAGLILLYQEVFRGDDAVPTTEQLKPFQVQAVERFAVLTANYERAKANAKKNRVAVEAARKLDDMNYGDCTLKYLKKMRDHHLGVILDYEKLVARNEQVLEREALLDDHLIRCPTCGTKVNASEIKEAVDKAQASITEAKTSIRTSKRELADFETAITLKEQAERQTVGEEMDFEVVARKLKKLELKTAALAKMIELAEKREDYLNRARKLKADFVKAKELVGFDVTSAKHLIQQQTRKLDALVVLKSVVEQYTELIRQHNITQSASAEMSTVKRRRIKLEEENIEIGETLTRKRIKLDRLKTIQSNYDDLVKEQDTLKTDLVNLRKLERRERIYKSLKKAYDRNGLKVRRLRELLKAIKTRLPVWTNILFTEKNMIVDVTGNEKKIGFEITQTTKTLNKRTGKWVKHTKTYDAGEASGSERTRISFALLLTMADVASSEKQCNLIVLDEPERGLDRQSKQIMSEEIVPLLKHRKPSLYLITHSLDVDPEHVNAKMLVRKRNQKSTIVFQALNNTNNTATNNTPSTKTKTKRSK